MREYEVTVNGKIGTVKVRVQAENRKEAVSSALASSPGGTVVTVRAVPAGEIDTEVDDYIIPELWKDLHDLLRGKL